MNTNEYCGKMGLNSYSYILYCSLSSSKECLFKQSLPILSNILMIKNINRTLVSMPKVYISPFTIFLTARYKAFLLNSEKQEIFL